PSPGQGSAGRTIVERAPIAWQTRGAQRVPVSAGFAVATNKSVHFTLGSYDHAQPLLIDPVLTYSTYLGGSSDDEGGALTVNTSQNVYMTGGTYSSNFPTVNPVQPSKAGSKDVFVSKFSADGQSLLYSTFIGGSDQDEGKAIALDSSGNIYIAGITR